MIIKQSNLPIDPKHSYWNNFSDLRNYIHYSLGGGVIRIELNDVHYNLGIIEAITRYYEFETTPVQFELLMLDTDKTFTLPDHIEPSLIKDVITVGTPNQFTSFDSDTTFLSLFYPSQLNNPVYSGIDLPQYILWRQRLDDLNNMLGISFTWEIIGNKLHTFPKNGTHDRVGIFYGGNLTPHDLQSDGWIRDYSVQAVKMIWGNILAKFSGFQSASGPANTQGERLVSEAIQEKARLIEEIKGRRPPMPILQM